MTSRKRLIEGHLNVQLIARWMLVSNEYIQFGLGLLNQPYQSQFACDPLATIDLKIHKRAVVNLLLTNTLIEF